MPDRIFDRTCTRSWRPTARAKSASRKVTATPTASRVGARLWKEKIPAVRLTPAEEKRLGVTAWELAVNGEEPFRIAPLQ